MIQVIRKLRSQGKTVHVVAVEKTMSKDVMSFVNQFTTVEALLGILPPAMYDMEMMIRRLDAAEYGKPFVGLKYFLRVLAGSDIVDRKTYELVNQAISDGTIETYKVPNPKDELFPTTACRLNRGHELVRRVLGPGSAAKAPPAAASSATVSASPHWLHRALPSRQRPGAFPVALWTWPQCIRNSLRGRNFAPTGEFPRACAPAAFQAESPGRRGASTWA